MDRIQPAAFSSGPAFCCPQTQWNDDLSENPFRKTTLMLGKTHNLMIQHGIYRALPHREGGGVPRNIVTDHYDREAVRAQLRKDLQSIRNVDMFSHLAMHVVRRHSRKATGVTSIPACIRDRASARPPVIPSAARTVASLLYPHRMETATTTPPSTPRPDRQSRPSTTVPIPSEQAPRIPVLGTGRTHRSISRPSRTPNPSSSHSSMSSRLSPPIRSMPNRFSQKT